MPISLNSAARRSTTGRGVPSGSSTPHHGETSMSPKPLSASVGTSGRLGFLFAEVTATMRTRLGCMVAAQVESTDMKSTLPDKRLANASPVTLKGT